MITTPATILSFFTILLFKNSGGSSVGGGGSEDGGPSDAIELGEVANPSDAEK
jgi:hypothetical protein